MPNQPKPAPGTRGRYLTRVPDDLWEAVKAEAARRGESISEATIRFYRDYVSMDQGNRS